MKDETITALIQHESRLLPTEAKWLLESAETINERAEKGTLRMSLINDVVAHAESLRLRLIRIDTLNSVLRP